MGLSKAPPSLDVPNSDALTPDPYGKREGSRKAEPERNCILSGEHGARDMLLRLAISPDGLVLPDVNAADLRAKLEAGRRFVRIKRELTPKQQEEIHELGLPGLAFIDEYRRVYPMGATASHVVGLVDVDSKGLSGIEKFIV